MSSKAITEKPELKPGDEWQPAVELAPSVLRADEPTVARWVGMAAFVLVALGLAIIYFTHFLKRAVAIGPIEFGPGGGAFLCFLSLLAALYHAASDSDTQVRRTYGLLGFFWLAAAIVVSVIPVEDTFGYLFLPWGALGLILALLFLLPFVHHETDPVWHERTILLFGIVGGLLAAGGLIGGVSDKAFLVPQGVALTVLGLGYLWAFISQRGAEDRLAYRAGQALAVAGFVAVAWVMVRWLGPEIWYRLGWAGRPGGNYFAESGLVLMVLGLSAGGLALGLCSDRQFVVMTRRELASFFYSPLAYLVLAGFFIIATYRFLIFSAVLVRMGSAGGGVMQVVLQYVMDIIPVIIQMLLAVPLLTMRLFSEERRSGTYEVLMTAPVSDLPVVLSKFLATLIVFLVTWLPFGLYLLALRLEAGSFDYYPILSFLLALVCSGANFLAMGLFCSSLTRNQIAAGVLAAGGMCVWIGMYFFRMVLDQGSTWFEVFRHLSFVDLWYVTLQGRIPVGDLVLHLSFAVFWLFLTVKVLETRKWS